MIGTFRGLIERPVQSLSAGRAVAVAHGDDARLAMGADDQFHRGLPGLSPRRSEATIGWTLGITGDWFRHVSVPDILSAPGAGRKPERGERARPDERLRNPVPPEGRYRTEPVP